MTHYLFEQETIAPPQDALLELLLSKNSAPSTKFSNAKSPEEVAAIIANDMLTSIKHDKKSELVAAST